MLVSCEISALPDVQAEKGYVPFKDDSEKWNTHDDGLDAGFVNPLKTVSKRFSDKPTALGGTTSSSVSGSFYAGVGPWDGSQWKGNTIGGSYSYSSDTSKGLSALVDLNGDGLPDKVYKSGLSLFLFRGWLGNLFQCMTQFSCHFSQHGRSELNLLIVL